jgi:hypothetical protein
LTTGPYQAIRAELPERGVSEGGAHRFLQGFRRIEDGSPFESRRRTAG